MEEKPPLLVGLLRTMRPAPHDGVRQHQRGAERLEDAAARQRHQRPGALGRRAAEQAPAHARGLPRRRPRGADRHRRRLARPARPDVSHVFNYDLPQDPDDYVHRIGRTARAGAEGDAISFGCEEYALSLPDIEEYIGRNIPSGADHRGPAGARSPCRTARGAASAAPAGRAAARGGGGRGGGRGGGGGGGVRAAARAAAAARRWRRRPVDGRRRAMIGTATGGSAVRRRASAGDAAPRRRPPHAAAHAGAAATAGERRRRRRAASCGGEAAAAPAAVAARRGRSAARPPTEAESAGRGAQSGGRRAPSMPIESPRRGVRRLGRVRPQHPVDPAQARADAPPCSTAAAVVDEQRATPGRSPAAGGRSQNSGVFLRRAEAVRRDQLVEVPLEPRLRGLDLDADRVRVGHQQQALAARAQRARGNPRARQPADVRAHLALSAGCRAEFAAPEVDPVPLERAGLAPKRGFSSAAPRGSTGRGPARSARGSARARRSCRRRGRAACRRGRADGVDPCPVGRRGDVRWLSASIRRVRGRRAAIIRRARRAGARLAHRSRCDLLPGVLDAVARPRRPSSRSTPRRRRRVQGRRVADHRRRPSGPRDPRGRACGADAAFPCCRRKPGRARVRDPRRVAASSGWWIRSTAPGSSSGATASSP